MPKPIFNKGLQLYLKKTQAQVFSFEFCDIFKKIFFCRTPWESASQSASIYVVNVLKHPKYILAEDKFSSRSNIPLNS